MTGVTEKKERRREVKESYFVMVQLFITFHLTVKQRLYVCDYMAFVEYM